MLSVISTGGQKYGFVSYQQIFFEKYLESAHMTRGSPVERLQRSTKNKTSYFILALFFLGA